MNLSHYATLVATPANRVARRLACPATLAPAVRLLRGPVAVVTLAALPSLAHAAEGGEAYEPAVLTAFGVLVAAAIVASIATACSRRHATAELAQQEYADGP
jgi:hypothetical protein